MTTEGKNIEILEHAYSQWVSQKAKNLDGWTAIVADNVRLTSLADGAAEVPFTSPRSGREAFREYLRGLTDEWDMLSYRIDEFIAQRDRVVAIGSTSWRNKKTGRVFDTPKIDVWRMQEGKVVEFTEFYDTAKVYAAAQP